MKNALLDRVCSRKKKILEFEYLQVSLGWAFKSLLFIN